MYNNKKRNWELNWNSGIYVLLSPFTLLIIEMNTFKWHHDNILYSLKKSQIMPVMFFSKFTCVYLLGLKEALT